ncbi:MULTISPECIES: choice-of-anchor D domain-containing protein [unclassified Nocardioides]|uniref:choice-of-anchor D domain-containing protein n=1 Tax=unclassified Nocardioides TaxID=2615069 RepID=UPI000703A3BA|nr:MULTISPECIES: choice-of-anchor D domain-containing protein [unclassified Nocardioides]KRC50052.1 hypothetical protein ASE19_15640 [Nocardioides sp. Root79]KRC75520.1 hypothetical protein ASE20_21660 [Nocardioides sp. Root240]
MPVFSARRLLVGLCATGLAATGVAALAPDTASAALPAQCSTAGDAVTCLFTQQGNYYLPIPDAVTSMQVHAVGQRGADAVGAPGGRPAYVDATIPTADKDAFIVSLRADGGAGTDGGGNGGGSATVTRTVGGSTPVVQAAGGGGAGRGTVAGGAGGDAGSPGQGGLSSGVVTTPAGGGGAGTATAGGAGGLGASIKCNNLTWVGVRGGAGAAYAGGRGGADYSGNTVQQGGGGGGGGRFGGGAGGGGATCDGTTFADGGGGGGGTSLAPEGSTIGVAGSESYLVRITFTLQPRSTYTPTSLAFAPQEIRTASAAKSATVTNTGSLPLAMGTAAFEGPGAASFVKGTDTCSGTSLAVGASCQVGVRFSPTTATNLEATLSIPSSSPTSPHLVALTGTGLPPADLKVLGIGSIYSGKGQLVTRTLPVSGSKLMVYKLGVLNEDTVARSYRLRLTSAGAPATAEVWTTGFGAKVLAKDPSGNFITPTVAAGKVVTLDLRITPTTPGQHTSHVDVDLLSDLEALIEGVSTETNTPAPAKGTSSYELTAIQGGQPAIGGPVLDQTVTAPALNVGQTASYTVRLKNDGASAAAIGFKLALVSGCNAYTAVAKVGATNITAAAAAGTYVTPVRPIGQSTNVTITVKRVATGCRAFKLQVQSLNAGVPVRSSYLLTNAAYAAATD